MDLETNRADSFVRRHSLSSSNAITPIDDDRHDMMENSSVMPIPVDALATTSIVSPYTSELTSPLSTEGIIHSNDENNENKKELPWVLDYGSQLIHLAVFGILGVLTRYLLQKLFGPGVIGLTSDQTVLYLDLPSNMVGSFLMGWFGVVFKGDISRVSDYLAVGLATGYLGSLTTFSGWNQKMLDLSVQSKWALVVFGYPIELRRDHEKKLKVFTIWELIRSSCPSMNWRRLVLKTILTRWHLPGIASLLRIPPIWRCLIYTYSLSLIPFFIAMIDG